MSTLVTFHAHPDDEAIGTGGTMAKAAVEGHRVVLVTATRGEHGEVPENLLDDGETLADRRMIELRKAARILGVARVEVLGYEDSGMIGTPANEAPKSFWRADVEEAAQRVSELLQEEAADVFTFYDPDGSYGHPDHIQVHRVGVLAAEMAGTRKVYEDVIGRESVVRNIEQLSELGFEMPTDIDFSTMGVLEATITTTVDVTDYLDVKRAAMAAHESQIPPTSMFLAIPREAFDLSFGTEEFRLRGAPEGLRESDLFEGCD